ncbi:NorD nitric oxide reductase activation protein (plasmid) [Aestuarium zhoushanense]|nr:NorD nitric oxide reductase activation protein [Aestuarium zhoushanense]
MKILDLMEPEETVGNLWHDMASNIGAIQMHADAAVSLTSVRSSLAVLFRALGGNAGVEIVESPASPARHRTPIRRKLATQADREHVARFDGQSLRLPPEIAAFSDRDLNRAAYFWLTACAALTTSADLPRASDAFAADCENIRLNAAAADATYKACPGLRSAYSEMAHHLSAHRSVAPLPTAEAEIEQIIRDQLCGRRIDLPVRTAERGYLPFSTVPIWLRFSQPMNGNNATEEASETTAPPAAVTSSRKMGERKDQDQTRRRDSFIIHRFEAILSWVESMNLNRSVDDDDDENAAKAADDQDKITLTKHQKKAATRLRLHLDLSPAEADHEKLAGNYVYPEWNFKSRSYMEAHCRVLDAPAMSEGDHFRPDPRFVRAVRRQFETLQPRRILRPRQVDGSELDLDALITTQADLLATGRGSDRIWQDHRQIQRDLAVAFLIDTSRSTEAAIGDTSVIEVARETMAAMAHGIDAAGDRLAIWGFSSLKRDRVFLTRVKEFAEPMGQNIEAKIGALKPSHFTRLGASIRHVSAQLAQEQAARRLLIVLTDGKPNDLDHYEGQHGIEDSHMAVREARRAGLTLHGVIVDEDGQDWFARIFGRGGFTLLPHPERMPRALPDIYRSLTQET